MNNISSFLFLLGIIIIILILLSIFHDNPIINSLSDKIVILVLFFSAYTGHETLSNNFEQTNYDNYLKISAGQFKIIEYINENYNKCPNFINTFFFDWQKKVLSKNNIVSEKIIDNWITVYYVSEMIFKSFDNYTSYINKIGLSNISVSNQKNYKLINFFIQFTISEDLYKIWNIYKFKYPDHTINFGDLLFLLTKEYKPTNVIELNKLVNIILNNKYYTTLFEKN
jgi:hypothetical protein